MLKILKSKAHVCLINSYKTIKRRHRRVMAVNGPKEDGNMDLCWGDSRMEQQPSRRRGSEAIHHTALCVAPGASSGLRDSQPLEQLLKKENQREAGVEMGT